MLFRLAFNSVWRRWMRGCYTANFVSMLVNGSPTYEFTASRGLKQGDPLAPFLFIVAAEGLPGLVRKAESSNLFSGFAVNENLSISLLQFADDTVLLCDGDERNPREQHHRCKYPRESPSGSFGFFILLYWKSPI